MCNVSLKVSLVCEDWRGSRTDPGNCKLINPTSEPDKLSKTLMKEGKKVSLLVNCTLKKSWGFLRG